MTLTEIKDQFNALYMLECQKRNIEKIPIGIKEVAFFISSAQQDIQRRLAVVTTSYDITLDGSTSYTLPSNFGNDVSVIVNTVPLEKKSVKWIKEILASGKSGDYYSIYTSGNTQYLLTTVSSGALTIYYHPDLNYYRPSLSPSQDWGNFDGIAYSGKLLIPDRYDMAVLYRMLGFVFPEYLQMYEKELRSLRESRVGSTEDTIMWNFGGDNELDSGVVGSVSYTLTEEIPNTNPDKFLRVRVTDTGVVTVSEATGWTTDPTAVNNISTIVITSADSEFSNFTHVYCNNRDFEWTGSTGTITVTAHPSSGWGSAEILIEIWT